MNWYWVATNSPTVDALKNGLYRYGPLVTTMRVYSDFFYYNGGIYSYSSGSYQGSHGVLLVGYDDIEQYFIVKNSWGTDWGESGYFRIAYSELNSVTSLGFWTIAYDGVGPSPPPTDTSIIVSSPNGGESWQAGTAQTVSWAYAGSPGSSVKIELFKSGLFNRTITSSTLIGSGGSGSYSWTVPSAQTPGSDYKIRVTSTSNGGYTDNSDYNFNITAPPVISSIAVSSPNGGESWQVSTTQNISWTYTGNLGSAIKIELLRSGVVHSTITSNTSIGSGGSGSYAWMIPSAQPPGSDYKIRVTSAGNSSYMDTSDDNFSIFAPTIISSIIVNSPNGWESWQAGTTHTITWTYTGNPGPLVRVELIRSGAVIYAITTNTPVGSEGSGSYVWTIPSGQKPSRRYKIKISTINGTYGDTSDQYFTIWR
jgi:hypothetical protein